MDLFGVVNFYLATHFAPLAKDGGAEKVRWDAVLWSADIAPWFLTCRAAYTHSVQAKLRLLRVALDHKLSEVLHGWMRWMDECGYATVPGHIGSTSNWFSGMRAYRRDRGHCARCGWVLRIGRRWLPYGQRETHDLRCPRWSAVMAIFDLIWPANTLQEKLRLRRVLLVMAVPEIPSLQNVLAHDISELQRALRG
jgi:hypothetical protein